MNFSPCRPLHFIPIALAIFASWPAYAADSDPSQFVLDKARFTVISPICVRMEYAAKRHFVDDPTLFAIDRTVRFSDSKISNDQKALIIDTGKLRLEYHPSGSSFSAENLKISFRLGQKNVVWTPGMNNQRNLGGPVPTLDGWSGPPKALSEGLLARDGWHLIDDSGRPLLRKGWIAQRPGGAPPVHSSLRHQTLVTRDTDWYLFAYGEDYKGALQALTGISGKVPMPRKEVLGSWYCRWHRYTADDFRQIVREYKEHDFPLDILVMDMDWHTQGDAHTGFGHSQNLGWTGYTWNKSLIPDPAGLLSEFKRDGISVVLNDHPCDGMREHEENYPILMQKLPPGTPENPPFNAGDPRYMEAFFASALEPLEKQGVDFWWLDWQQNYIYPNVTGVPYLEHLPWLNFLYYRNSEKSGRRGASFSRWGGWGDHRHPIQFSGDAVGTWEMLAFEIPFTAVSGNAGCFFWAHDLGGFTGERNPEMFTRWVEFGALSASLRVHSCGDKLDRRPWLWGEPFESAMRSAYKLRVSLMPYLYSSVRQCHDAGLPLVRPMYLDYPEHEEAYANPQQYMLGDLLLVAPIAKPGTGDAFTAEQNVWLPPGTWVRYSTGERFEGGKTIQVKAGIADIPLFVKGGAPIPLQPDTPRMTSAPLKTLKVRIYPGDSGTFSLYEDDGQSKGYTADQYATTALQSTRKNNQLVLTVGPAKGSYAGQLKERACIVELPATPKGLTATLNGTAVPVVYDVQAGMNSIALPTCPITKAQTLTITQPVPSL